MKDDITDIIHMLRVFTLGFGPGYDRVWAEAVPRPS